MMMDERTKEALEATVFRRLVTPTPECRFWSQPKDSQLKRFPRRPEML
jgi:hypothetical protein